MFFWHKGDPCPQPAQLDTDNDTMIRCEYLTGYDSFQGSEAAYIYGVIYLVFFPVFCVCAGYGVIKLNNSRRRRAKNNEPDAHCFGKSESSASVGGVGGGDGGRVGGVGGQSGGGGGGAVGGGAKKRKKSTEEKRISAREWCDPTSSRPVTVNLGPGTDISLVNRCVHIVGHTYNITP